MYDIYKLQMIRLQSYKPKNKKKYQTKNVDFSEKNHFQDKIASKVEFGTRWPTRWTDHFGRKLAEILEFLNLENINFQAKFDKNYVKV